MIGKILKIDSEDEYISLARFASDNKRLSYQEFDEHTLKDVSLFVVPKDEHFRELNLALDKIIKALPSLKRIFAKPIIRLADVHNILPVESVRVIDNQSMSHASHHSELWGNIEKGELKPKKLLTLDRVDFYAIYENVAFTRLINLLLSFVKHSARLLKDVTYAHKDLKFNLLERTNHLSFFLAIGKLHTGYVRAQNKTLKAYAECLNKLAFIDNTLRSKLNSTVYRVCKKVKTKISLKKTNIFRNQKDYKQVYNLLKWFNADNKDIDENFLFSNLSDSGYTAFVNMLTVFAASHFNFEFDQKQRFNFLKLNAMCSFNQFKTSLKNVSEGEHSALVITTKKECTYSTCLIFASDDTKKSLPLSFKEKVKADEYLFLSSTEYGEKDTVYLNLFDVDSFRRIQQIILRGMLFADTERKTCPFCGEELQPVDDSFVCITCGMEITEKTCPTTQKIYYQSGLKNYKIPKETEETSIKNDKFLYDKIAESALFYRNVSPLSLSGETICPHCGKIHEE